MKIKTLIKTVSLIAIFIFGTSFAGADAPDINLTIRSGGNVIFSGAVPLPPTGTVEINSHSLDADSILSILNNADTLSDDFSISDLEYYDSFGSFYLKCITSSLGKDCDNWQYTVNDAYPGISMDQKILSGGESVYVYFGSQYRISLDSNTITTEDNLEVTAEEYNYSDDTWKTRTGVTVGLTQANPDDPFSPIEITTNTVNATGVANFSGISEGSYGVGIKEDYYFPIENLTVTAPPPPAPIISGSSGNGSSYTPLSKKEFDVQKALKFLLSQQKENSSFGEDIYTDWSAIAIASLKNQELEPVIKLIKYFTENKILGTLLTDFERRAIALMALGLNPYDTNGENYIKKIIDNFDGKQFGDINEDNDDIFALIALSNAGFAQTDQMILDDISFVLSRQKENGSWDESIDMTGAGIGALSAFSGDEDISETLLKAKEFLKQSQKDDGGWGNVSSTAWAIEGILSLSEKPENWKKISTQNWIENSPLDYLEKNQDTDGGIKNEYLQNKIWETAYAIISVSGKTWNQIMQDFANPSEEISIEKKTELEKKLDKILLLLGEKNITKPTAIKNIKKVEQIETIKKPTMVKAKTENKEDIGSSITLPEVKIETKKTSWFKNFLNKILEIF